MKTLELQYLMIQFLIIAVYFPWRMLSFSRRTLHFAVLFTNFHLITTGKDNWSYHVSLAAWPNFLPKIFANYDHQAPGRERWYVIRTKDKQRIWAKEKVCIVDVLQVRRKCRCASLKSREGAFFKIFTWGFSAPSFNPLPILTEKIPLSYTFN